MPKGTNVAGNQHLVEAVPGIMVSVIDATFAGGTSNLAESAIIISKPDGREDIVGIQHHGRFNDKNNRVRTNRAIACQIARSIRAREAKKQG